MRFNAQNVAFSAARGGQGNRLWAGHAMPACRKGHARLPRVVEWDRVRWRCCKLAAESLRRGPLSGNLRDERQQAGSGEGRVRSPFGGGWKPPGGSAR
jgi:hypothetical protein